MAKKYTRIIVIAPTRSTCVNIHTVLSNGAIPETLLMRLMEKEIKQAVVDLSENGFGVVAGTGTGKTVALSDISKSVLGTNELEVGVVTREHEANDHTWLCNVLVVTPGIALNWLKSGRIGVEDLIAIDEIHQTSAQLELSMALIKHVGCDVLWMSATIDPEVYRHYFRSNSVITCDAFDPTRKAEVEYYKKDGKNIVDFMRDMAEDIISEGRGVAVFVPSRDLAEKVARELAKVDGLYADFYHGGESADKLRPFLTGEIKRPFVISMTIAGASSLNIAGLDTVVIMDEWYTEVVQGGVKTLAKLPLGANELLQMGGRVNGRAVNGKIIILTDRQLDFHGLKATAPQFVLGGDLETTALACAKLGVDARELDLIGGLSHADYVKVVDRFRARGLIVDNGEHHLTPYGERVERLPVEPHYGEILVEAEDGDDRDLLNTAVVVSCTEQLYSLHGKNWERFSVVVPGSDHLTAYNIIAQAMTQFAYIRSGDGGSEYALRGAWVRGYGAERTFGEFASWCNENGFSAKAIKNVLLAMKSVYRQLDMDLPDPSEFEPITRDSDAHKAFVDLLARVQSLDFVQNEMKVGVGRVFSSKEGVATAFRTLGVVRFWNDTRGIQRASMEGTDIPEELVHRYAHNRVFSILGMADDGEQVRVQLSARFAGDSIPPFKQTLDVDSVPDDLKPELPLVFAKWLSSGEYLATGDVGRVLAVNNDQQRRAKSLNARTGEDTFKVYSRDELIELYFSAIDGARCLSEISNPQALALPSLDENLAAKALLENPDFINILGLDCRVAYSDYRYGFESCPVLFFNVDWDDRLWLELPDEGVFLPGGRQLEVRVLIGGMGGVEHGAGTDIPALKRQIRANLNKGQWSSWYSRPEIPLPHGDFPKLPEIITAVYGKDIVDGGDLVAYGVAAVNPKRYFAHDPHFTGQWYQLREEAEAAHAKALERLRSIDRHADSPDQLNGARRYFEAVRNEIKSLESHRYWRDLGFSLRLKAEGRISSYSPSTVEAIHRWVDETRGIIANIKAELQAITRVKESERSRSAAAMRGLSARLEAKEPVVAEPETGVGFEDVGDRYFKCKCGAMNRVAKGDWKSFQDGDSIEVSCSCGHSAKVSQSVLV